jgi:hypothetical protein
VALKTLIGHYNIHCPVSGAADEQLCLTSLVAAFLYTFRHMWANGADENITDCIAKGIVLWEMLCGEDGYAFAVSEVLSGVDTCTPLGADVVVVFESDDNILVKLSFELKGFRTKKYPGKCAACRQIPAIAEKPLAACGCRKFQLDALGDHLCTCTAY